MRKTQLFIIGLTGAVLAVGCKEKQEDPTAMPAMPPAAVTVAPAVAKDVPVYLDEIGKSVAVETVSVVPQVAGKIIATHVNDGDFVTKGQLLFEIDPRPFQAVLDQAKAAVNQAVADARETRSEAD